MNKISILSRVLLIISALFLIIAIFVPMWRIELDAPQYPEGLELLIYSYKLAGNVDIINGLNHYIGMKTLNTADFIEFKLLPYIIGFYALLFIISAIIGTKKWLYISFVGLLLFGIVSMIDFYMWEYNYGHNLDPNAAIIVPGMAYQPPLIGFKQLLNFGAYSIPALGGWLFIASGALLLTGVLIVKGVFNKFKKSKVTPTLLFGLIVLLLSCTDSGPQPIVINKDKCDHCRMTISDGRFGAELITTKGRAYKFDDIVCMLGYTNDNKELVVQTFYVSDFKDKNILIDAGSAVFLNHETFKSPMNGNIAAFKSESSSTVYSEKLNVAPLKWNDLKKD